MKKILWLFLSFVIAGLIVPYEAGAASPSIVIDGVVEEYDQPPVIENGRTLVPMRGIFETLGASVEWEAETQSILASRSGTTVELEIGDNTAYVNGESVALSVPPKVINGRTVVPLRFVSESLGADVGWDSGSRTVRISSEDGINKLISEPSLFQYHQNTADGITLNYLAENLSGKTIDYYTLVISTYNPVGDPSYDQINGQSTFEVQYVGPAYPGDEIVMYHLFTYQGALHSIYIDEIHMTFSDGSTATQIYGYHTTDSSGFN